MANIIAPNDLRAGHTIFFNNSIYLVLGNSFNKTAMRKAIVKCKVKNLRTGAITTEVISDKVEQAQVDKRRMSFVFEDGTDYTFMDNTTYDQISVPLKMLEWEKNFIAEGVEVSVLSYEGEILGLSLPDKVTLEVKHAEDAVQGNSVSNAMKKAVLVTGYELDVPQFIKTGEKVIIDTENGTFDKRAN
ncbi:elongation factor P [[Mycoplasma] testudinis]|uniref:elongation factor P n=1 Tax=[Mycoplasma] testudinis TaxID=33924 RepID=UPI0004805AE2|nr:elongation factor P [[Mycoplasma] testudinis]